MELQSGLDTC